MTTITTTELTEKTATNFLTDGQLSVIVPQAQKGDHRAIKMLYDSFTPMIKPALSDFKAYAILGEDAENIAWLKFLEIVMAYKDEDYANLPGLLKVNVRYALTDAMECMQKYHSKLIWDAKAASGRHFYEPGAYDLRLEAVQRVVTLQQAMRKLSTKQREIVLQTVLGDLSLKEYSKQAEISYTAAFTLRKRALRILKKYL